MNKSFFYAFFLTLIMSLVSCGDSNNGKNKDGKKVVKETLSSGAIQIASDESLSPIVEEERSQFEFLCRNKAQVTPIYTNDVDGFEQLMSGKIHLYFTTRDLKKSEQEYMKTQRGSSPLVYKLGYDGVTFIVNRENKDTCITVGDVQRILSGETTNWSQVVKGSKRGEIKVVFDNKESATVSYCIDSILGGKPINSPNIVAAKNSKGVIETVESTPNAIGIIGSNWVMDHRDPKHLTFNMNIQVMSVTKAAEATPKNSRKPFQAYLLDGSYPFVRTIYAILSSRVHKLSLGFAEYCASPNGQLIILRSGLLPYRGDMELKEVNVKQQ